MFKIGDYVVHKRNVCKINKIRTIKDKDYYVMNPIDDQTLIINVPVDDSTCCLRSTLSRGDAIDLINSLHKVKVIDTTDKMIENQYKLLLQTGKHEDLICIIKTAYLRNVERKKSGKKIGEIDDSYFKLAEKILYNELSISLGKNYDDTKNYVIETVRKLSDD